jgi:hypothetical protein
MTSDQRELAATVDVVDTVITAPPERDHTRCMWSSTTTAGSWPTSPPTPPTANIRAAAEDAHKDAILGDQTRPSGESLASRLTERRSRVPSRAFDETARAKSERSDDMKAQQILEFGSLDNLRLVDVPLLEPSPVQIRIKWRWRAFCSPTTS